MGYIGSCVFVDVPQHTHKDQQQQQPKSSKEPKPDKKDWKKVDHRQFRGREWGWWKDEKWRGEWQKRSPSIHTGWANKMVALLAAIGQNDTRANYLMEMLLSC